ncbi:MAG: O-antigen ligase family protein [Ardenticatenia bacterium]|nr:O-antigen ligase family protein [Ardenticatenia bacterium]
MVVTMGLAMVLTFSRGAMLGLVAGLTPLMVLRYRRLIPYAVAGGLLLLLLPQAQVYLQRFVEGFRGQDLATQMRFGEYKDAWRLIQRYPWFGVGFSGTPDIDLYIGVSSVYLLMAEFMGLVGLGTFLTTMVAFFVLTARAVRALQGDERVEPLLLGATSAILGAMVGGIFDHYFFNITFPHSVALFWLFVGVAVAAARIGIEAQETDDEPDADNPLLLIWQGANMEA